MGRVYFNVEGMPKLMKSIEKLGKVPQKHVNSSVKNSMSPTLREARSNAPEDVGNLKRGIIMVDEKSKHKAKKVYRLVFAKEFNWLFQKPIKNPGSKGSPRPKSIGYYPIAQEYGYFAGDGNFIPGYHFIQDAFDRHSGRLPGVILKYMQQKIDKEIAKEGLK